MPARKSRAGVGQRRCPLCNGHGLHLARVVTFNRTFIPGFLLSAALGFLRLGAFVVGTDQEGTRLQVFLQQIGTAALRTGFCNRFVSRREPALRVIGAAVEEVAAARFFLGEVSGLAFRALHADIVLLHPLAFRITAAGDELSVTAMPQQQVASTLRAFLLEWNV